MHELLVTLRFLCPVPPIEIRALADRMMVRQFTDHAEAAKWAEAAAVHARAVYVVMNPFDPSKIRGTAVDDQAVTSRRWLLIDVDPARAVDMNSSREELEMATSTAFAIEALLTESRFPLPIRALSGNGAHLLYSVDMPNDADSLALVNGVLRYLSSEFSVAEKVSVDTTVGNAARITKLYGTLVRKGPNVEGRPHRQSKITRVPVVMDTVSVGAMRAVAARLAPEPLRLVVPAGTKPVGEYDLGNVLSRVPVRRTFEKDGSTWHVVQCPWSHEHSTSMEDEATVVTVGSGGGLGFRCLHAHCSDRRWEDFRDHLGIETRGWQNLKGKFGTGATVTKPAERKPSQRVTVADINRRGDVMRRMDDYIRTGAMPGSLSTGMRRLDGMLLGGLRPGKLYVLGGESGRGKTTLLLQWAFHVARDPGVNLVGIVTPEMDHESLDERAYAQLTGCSVGEFKRAEEAREMWRNADAPQKVRASFDPKDIQAFADEEKPSLFIVDYAQQAVDYEAERRHTALARLGADCLSIAKTNWIPVLLGTQVNVTAERDFTVRETRIIEHQADVIMFIDVQYEKTPDYQGRRQLKPGAGLVVEKNRHGATGRIDIEWDRERFRFKELPA